MHTTATTKGADLGAVNLCTVGELQTRYLQEFGEVSKMGSGLFDRCTLVVRPTLLPIPEVKDEAAEKRNAQIEDGDFFSPTDINNICDNAYNNVHLKQLAIRESFSRCEVNSHRIATVFIGYLRHSRPFPCVLSLCSYLCVSLVIS